jgi:hypothetical protein
VENIQVIAAGELVNIFAFGTIRVSYNHYLRSMAFKAGEQNQFFLRSESRQIPLERNDIVGSQNDTHNYV